MFYKNTSTITKKFHGIEFKPGDIKECSKFINDLHMVTVDKPKEQLSKPAKPAKPEPKQEVKAEQEAKSDDASK